MKIFNVNEDEQEEEQQVMKISLPDIPYGHNNSSSSNCTTMSSSSSSPSSSLRMSLCQSERTEEIKQVNRMKKQVKISGKKVRIMQLLQIVNGGE